MTKEAGDLYAKVMVDTPGLGLLDYAVPADMLVAVGDRVVVGLRTRNVVGIVAGLRAAADFAENRVRQIKAVLRDSAPMTEEWLALTRFAAGYYIRSWGEAAVPTLPVFFRRIPGVRHQNQLEKLKKLPEARAQRRTECGGGGRLDGFRLQPLPSVRRDGVGQDRSLSSHHGAGSCP